MMHFVGNGVFAALLLSLPRSEFGDSKMDLSFQTSQVDYQGGGICRQVETLFRIVREMG